MILLVGKQSRNFIKKKYAHPFLFIKFTGLLMRLLLRWKKSYLAHEHSSASRKLSIENGTKGCYLNLRNVYPQHITFSLNLILKTVTIKSVMDLHILAWQVSELTFRKEEFSPQLCSIFIPQTNHQPTMPNTYLSGGLRRRQSNNID